MDARSKLQQALTGTYTIERELGGGGMSRVFVAMEPKLGRRVVIKVLPADVAAAVSASRFEREILVAAGLTQANIVPVLASGQVEGVPWYTMPFIEGESLRTRLQRGPLSEREAVNVLRDVARALAFAHEHGVIHRDIKPDNVLLSGDTAVVTDFGIAKAISAARTGSGAGATATGLTQVGTSIGTPAYMAPEQAAGDPDTDHRADLYAFGCLAFELLTGRRPFAETMPHKLMAAHMSTPAPHVRDVRPETNGSLDTLIAACMEKSPADRPQSARDLLAQLDAALSTSGSGTATIAFTKQTSLPKAIGIWLTAFAATWILARAAVVGIGLPEWTVTLALVVSGLGLPVVLFTWYVQHTARRALLTTPTRTAGGSPVHSTMATMALRAAPLVSWKRTWRGGILAGGFVAVALIAVMTLRAFGIGPAASLLNAGRIEKNSRVLLAQFQATTSDTSLGTVVTQAMRTSLGQSNAVQLVSQAEAASGLRRMNLPEGTELDGQVARDLAIRDGVPLVLTGRVASAGAGFMVSASLMRADSGTVLVTLQEGANGAADLLGAVDEVARGMRSRIGESLRTLARTPPLEQVTTRSLDALREYSRGLELGDARGDFVAGRQHIRAAVAADSTFAQAWRKLAVYGVNLGAPLSEVLHATTQAYRYRDRLTDVEREEVEAWYLMNLHTARSNEYYAAHPRLSQNNRGINLTDLGRYASAESLLTDEIAAMDARGEKPIVQLFVNLMGAQFAAGNIEGLRRTAARVIRDFRGVPASYLAEAQLAMLVSLDSGEIVTDLNTRRAPPLGALRATGMLATFAMAHGQLARGARLAQRTLALQDSLRIDYNPFANTASAVTWLTALRGNVSAGLASLDSIAARMPKDLAAVDAADLELAEGYAQMGRPEKAAAHLAAFERGTTAEEKYARWYLWQAARGEVALAQGRPDEAIAAFRRSGMADSGVVESAWSGRTSLRLARAFDKAGNADSAIAHFEALRRPGMRWGLLTFAPVGLAIAPRRLGELYEDKGDLAKAIESYEAFVELWKNADAELQPQVADVRARIARLRAAEARQR